MSIELPEIVPIKNFNIKKAALKNKKWNRVITPSKTLVFMLDYPLNKPVYFQLKMRKPGIQLKHLVRAVQRAYRKIYQVEATTSNIEAGHIPGMLNRNETDGTYGIWGHDLDDLVIEEISYDRKTKVWSFYIGS
jgi:hypothetical protein